MAQLKKPTIKNPALVSAMAEFKAKQNPQTEKEMLDAIAEASFIAPIALQKQLDEVEPDENGQRLMRQAYERLNLSARAYNRVMKVARTIADLSGGGDITYEHIAEAIQYRTVDKKYWGE